MHLKKIPTELRDKIIAVVVAFVLCLGAIIGNQMQKKRITDLENKLQLKYQLEDQRTYGYTESSISEKTIVGEFNRLQDYAILKNYKITMTHTYHYDKNGVLGIHKRGRLSGSATCVYDIDVRLSEAKVVRDKGVFIITLKKPFLNQESVHMEQNTLLINHDRTNMNIFCGDREGSEIMMYFMNSFNTSAIDKLKDYYETDYQQEKLRAIAKQEVGNLLKSLGVNNYKIIIEK